MPLANDTVNIQFQFGEGPLSDSSNTFIQARSSVRRGDIEEAKYEVKAAIRCLNIIVISIAVISIPLAIIGIIVKVVGH